jgi:hypothetical protein
MLLRNMSVKQGLCNGSRFVLLNCDSPHVLKCELIPPSPLPPGESPLQFFLPRINLTPPDGYYLPFTRKQFPILPAFAQTINKSQGGTYDRVGLDLQQPVFSHGQLYVALSRVRNFHSLRILLPKDDTHTENIVCHEVLDAHFRPPAQPAPQPPPVQQDSCSDSDGNDADDEHEPQHELRPLDAMDVQLLEWYHMEDQRAQYEIQLDADYQFYLSSNEAFAALHAHLFTHDELLEAEAANRPPTPETPPISPTAATLEHWLSDPNLPPSASPPA